MLQAAPLISLPLPLVITLHQFRVLLAALFLIMGMLAPPLLLAVAHDLAIFRVSRQFLAVIIGAAPALTLRLASDHLLRAINGNKWKAETNFGSKDNGGTCSSRLPSAIKR